MNKPETTSLYQFLKQFPNEESARLYFEAKRWNGAPVCAHCGSMNAVECKDHRPMPYRCRDCRKHFSVRTGTVLAESKIELQKWLMAIYMMTTARKGIPSTQMARELGITQKSAWFLAQRIRETWLSNHNDSGPMGGEVECDETYVGGKEMNKHASKKLHAGRGTVGKTIVAGIKQRNGVVVAAVVPSTSARVLQSFIRANVQAGSTVYTDEHSSYSGMNDYTHFAVRHGTKEFVNGMAHTNGIESFWALLKRGYYGVYHYMSTKHLHRYINEFANRHNTAQYSTMEFIGATVERISGKRLTYKELINA